MIESLEYTIEQFDPLEWVKSGWEATKSGANYVYGKAKDAVNYVVDKGIDWFMEQIREALFSWGGAAVQAFLATSTGGVGNAVLVVVWGAMLAYDLYRGIAKNDWNWVYILIDLVAVITTGPGAKIMHGIFKGLGLLGKKLPLKDVIQATKASKSGSWFGNMLNSIVKGGATIVSYMLQGITWLSNKIGLKALGNYTNKLKTSLNTYIDDLGKAATTPQAVPKPAVKPAPKPAPATPKKPGVLSNVKNTAGNILKTRPAKIGAAAGIGYGIDKVTGGDTRVFGAAFRDKDEELYAATINQPAEYAVEDLP